MRWALPVHLGMEFVVAVFVSLQTAASSICVALEVACECMAAANSYCARVRLLNIASDKDFS